MLRIRKGGWGGRMAECRDYGIRCVACGDDSHYLRYKVVPACYRRHFPVHLKSHRSHDIVLLCVDCHEVAHQAAAAVKLELARYAPRPLPRTCGTRGGVGSLWNAWGCGLTRACVRVCVCTCARMFARIRKGCPGRGVC